MPEDTQEKTKTLLRHGFRYALSLTHEITQAEDLLQDAWVAVLRARGPRKRAYLFSAIRSRFLDQQRRAQLVVIESLEDNTQYSGQEVQPSNEMIFANTEMLDKALSILRPVEREALLLSEIEGYTTQEIANLTGQPRGTVLSLIYRSRQKLKKHLLLHAEKENHA
ncbi:MAG: RNA polymerase sigma factor [Nitrospirota bacterium]|nr:RNA polymerase sigma factor [Nitrospirota bacterium]